LERLDLGERGLILLAKILEMNRTHLIWGQNMAKEEGLASLGMRAKKVELVLPPILADFGHIEPF
jgi:hypothetical protein